MSPDAYGSFRGPDAVHLAAFRSYLGVQIVKANARLKRQRLHLVGRTIEEARALAYSQPTRTSWNPCTDCPSRFPANYNSQGPITFGLNFSILMVLILGNTKPALELPTVSQHQLSMVR